MHSEMEKKYVKSLIDVIVLALLTEREAHGYELMVRLQKEFNVIVYPSKLYPILYSLERRGLISGETSSGKKKRVYRLTLEGKLVVKTLLDDLSKAHQAVCKRLERSIKSNYGAP